MIGTIVYVVIMFSIAIIVSLITYYDVTKHKRDYKYSVFWETCSEKRARKAIMDICSNPNLNLATMKTIADYSGYYSNPIIDAAKANNYKIVELLIQHGCNPFRKILSYEGSFGESDSYHCAADYAYNTCPQLQALIEDFKRNHPHVLI